MTEIPAIIKRVNGLHGKIGSDVVGQFGGFLRCETCLRKEPLTGKAAGSYLAHGWPRCCGYTMRWWTKRQVDAGEVPGE